MPCHVANKLVSITDYFRPSARKIKLRRPLSMKVTIKGMVTLSIVDAQH